MKQINHLTPFGITFIVASSVFSCGSATNQKADEPVADTFSRNTTEAAPATMPGNELIIQQ